MNSTNGTRSHHEFVRAFRRNISQGLRALGSDCSRPEVAAALASLATYDSGNVQAIVPASDLNAATGSLQSAGFTKAKIYEITSGKCSSLFDGTELDESDA